MDLNKLYQQKKASVDECLNLIRDNDRIVFGKERNEPVMFCDRLHTLKGRVSGVTALKGRTGNSEFLRTEGMGESIMAHADFYGLQWSSYQDMGNALFVATAINDAAEYYGEFWDPNVFVAAVCPMDEDGNFQVGMSLMWEKDFYDRHPEKVILEVNPNIPRTHGGFLININDVTALYENDQALSEITPMPFTDVEAKIGEYVASLVKDGDTIQLGIGGIPDAVAKKLQDHKDLGLHTEMFTTEIGRMIKKGVITGERKNFHKGEHLGVFISGLQELYDTVSSNEKCIFMPGSYVVDPMNIMKNDNMVSINTCIEMDLTGQVCGESVGTRQVSGPGGCFAFAYGAIHSKGGRGILAFPSKTAKGYSKIKSTLTPGAQVTIPRPYVDCIVTEYGIAYMRGRTLTQRVHNLVAIAHPDDRAELLRQARELHYI